MGLPNWIVSPTLTWLPPLLLSILIISGLLIGFLNGWRSALYFLTVNAFSLIIGILSFALLWKNQVSPKLLSSINSEQEIITQDELAGLVKSSIMLIYLSIILAVFLLISLIPYIFLRKYLKKQLKIDKKNKIFNWKSRFIGSGIGFLTVLPQAAFITTITSAMLIPSREMTSSFNVLSSIFTFGEVDTISEDIRDAMGLFSIVSNPEKTKQKTEEIQKIFSKLADKTTNEKEIIKSIINNKDIIQSIIRRPGIVNGIINGINAEAKKEKVPQVINREELSKKIQLLKNNEQKALEILKQSGIEVTKNQLDKLIFAFR
ncbi:MAG: hypothetical protein GY679_00655 [Mycoplasma sp.]|nr:hypothetical protein [Mycoplasma sp.]